MAKFHNILQAAADCLAVGRLQVVSGLGNVARLSEHSDRQHMHLTGDVRINVFSTAAAEFVSCCLMSSIDYAKSACIWHSLAERACAAGHAADCFVAAAPAPAWIIGDLIIPVGRAFLSQCCSDSLQMPPCC